MSLYIPLAQALISNSSPEAPTMADVLAKSPKLIGIYYSMHDCPPCREFTPLLAALYEEVNEDAHQMEIIFFSGDKTDAVFNEYFGEMPWLALPRANKEIMMSNARRFKIKGVPRLVMLRASDGKILAD
jgi:nucleoredoxin